MSTNTHENNQNKEEKKNRNEKQDTHVKNCKKR